MNPADNVDDVYRIAKWYISKSRKRYRMAMLLGGVEDVIGDVWVALLTKCPDGITLSTAVCNQVKWVIGTAWQKRFREFASNKVGAEFAEQVPADDEDWDGWELSEEVGKALRGLTYRQRIVIQMRFGLGDGISYSLLEVGKVLKVKRERIRQIEYQSLKKLQHERLATGLFSAAYGLPFFVKDVDVQESMSIKSGK